MYVRKVGYVEARTLKSVDAGGFDFRDHTHYQIATTVVTFIIEATGEESPVVVTASGLLAAAHLVGPGGLARMFREGSVVFDGNRVPATYYMERFGGYDLSGSLD